MQHLYFCEIPSLIKDHLSTFHLRLFCNIWCTWIHMWFTCVIFPFTGVSTYLSLRKRFLWFWCGFFEAALRILPWEKVHIQNNGKSKKEPCFNWIKQAWSHWINDLMVNLHQWIKKKSNTTLFAAFLLFLFWLSSRRMIAVFFSLHWCYNCSKTCFLGNKFSLSAP